jgi:hypothetical protein
MLTGEIWGIGFLLKNHSAKSERRALKQFLKCVIIVPFHNTPILKSERFRILTAQITVPKENVSLSYPTHKKCNITFRKERNPISILSQSYPKVTHYLNPTMGEC